MKKILICAALLCFALPGIGWACSCLYKSVEEPLDKGEYDAIFVGEVEGIVREDETGKKRFRVFSIRVIENLGNGELGDKTEVLTAVYGTACSYNFLKAKKHLIFARALRDGAYIDRSTDGVPYITSKCDFSKPLSEADDLLKILQEKGYDHRYIK